MPLVRSVFPAPQWKKQSSNAPQKKETSHISEKNICLAPYNTTKLLLASLEVQQRVTSILNLYKPKLKEAKKFTRQIKALEENMQKLPGEVHNIILYFAYGKDAHIRSTSKHGESFVDAYALSSTQPRTLLRMQHSREQWIPASNFNTAEVVICHNSRQNLFKEQCWYQCNDSDYRIDNDVEPRRYLAYIKYGSHLRGICLFDGIRDNTFVVVHGKQPSNSNQMSQNKYRFFVGNNSDTHRKCSQLQHQEDVFEAPPATHRFHYESNFKSGTPLALGLCPRATKFTVADTTAVTTYAIEECYTKKNKPVSDQLQITELSSVQLADFNNGVAISRLAYIIPETLLMLSNGVLGTIPLDTDGVMGKWALQKIVSRPLTDQEKKDTDKNALEQDKFITHNFAINIQNPHYIMLLGAYQRSPSEKMLVLWNLTGPNANKRPLLSLTQVTTDITDLWFNGHELCIGTTTDEKTFKKWITPYHLVYHFSPQIGP